MIQIGEEVELEFVIRADNAASISFGVIARRQDDGVRVIRRVSDVTRQAP